MRIGSINPRVGASTTLKEGGREGGREGGGRLLTLDPKEEREGGKAYLNEGASAHGFQRCFRLGRVGVSLDDDGDDFFHVRVGDDFAHAGKHLEGGLREGEREG